MKQRRENGNIIRHDYESVKYLYDSGLGYIEMVMKQRRRRSKKTTTSEVRREKK